jgi:hypothetical protein
VPWPGDARSRTVDEVIAQAEGVAAALPIAVTNDVDAAKQQAASTFELDDGDEMQFGREIEGEG